MKRNYIPIPVAAAVIGIVFGLTACRSKTTIPKTDLRTSAGESVIVIPLSDVPESPDPEFVSATAINFSDTVPQTPEAPASFSAAVDDFIACFNSRYERTHSAAYLPSASSSAWTQTSALSPRFGYESVQYRYSEDPAVWPMPTVSVYAPDGGAEIYEVRLVFDDHGYQERFFALFRDLSLSAIGAVLPELSGGEADTLFETLYAQSGENFFGDHSSYGDPECPPLSRVFRSGNVGLYCYYGSGNVELCMIPLSPSALELLKSENVPIEDWERSK